MKTIAYDYLFNYFGGDTFKGKIITGACVTLAIRPFKDGKEVKFEEKIEPSTHGKYLSEVFYVSFDRNKLFEVNRNLYADNLFRLVLGFDEIKSEIVGYGLDYYEGKSKDIFPDLDLKEFDDMPVSSVMAVTETEFRDFLSNHIDDFDMSDNQKAQVPSVSFI